MNYVFQKGTCLKKEIFQKILDGFFAAGWKDISSKAASDYYVLNSKGETDDKNLIINLREVNSSGANSVLTTDFCQFSYRLQTGYTPGDTGAAGIFKRPNMGWRDLYIVPVANNTQVGGDMTITYYQYADKNKQIMMITYPNATGYLPVLIYIGISEKDSLYTPESDSRGIVCGSNINVPTNLCVQVSDTPDKSPIGTDQYSLSTYSLLVPLDPNADNKSFLSSVYYGSAAEGYRGKMDGIKLVYFSGSNFVTGDTIIVDTATYTVFIVASINSTSFNSRGIALRTA